MLVALLLPAVQAAREAARKIQCQNHIKQWTLALHNHHVVHNTIPAGWTALIKSGSNTSHNHQGSGWSTTFLLLPFLEQQARWDGALAYISANNNTLASWNDNLDFMTGTIPALCCPSNQWAQAARIATHVADAYQTRTSYHPSWGGWIRAQQSTTEADAIKFGYTGLFTKYVEHDFAGVTDGLSNTIAVSECVNAEGWKTNLIKGGSAELNGELGTPPFGDGVSWGSGTPQSACSFAVVANTDRITYKTAVHNTGRGLRMACGAIAYSGFVCVMPPNSPSCLTSGGDQSWGIVSASSNHSGGVNVGLADGSVRFVSETVDCGNQAAVQNIAGGASPYGVWGALGTPQGGETVALPYASQITGDKKYLEAALKAEKFLRENVQNKFWYTGAHPDLPPEDFEQDSIYNIVEYWLDKYERTNDKDALNHAVANAHYAFLYWCPKQLSWVKSPTQLAHSEQIHYNTYAVYCYNNRKVSSLDRLYKHTGSRLYLQLRDRVIQNNFYPQYTDGDWKGSMPEAIADPWLERKGGFEYKGVIYPNEVTLELMQELLDTGLAK